MQIGDENVHRVRALMDEVFGDSNFVSEIVFKKSVRHGTVLRSNNVDFILWYARTKVLSNIARYLILKNWIRGAGLSYRTVREADEKVRRMNRTNTVPADGNRVFLGGPFILKPVAKSTTFEVDILGRKVSLRKGGWKTNAVRVKRLIKADRLFNTRGHSSTTNCFLMISPQVGIPNLWHRYDGYCRAEQSLRRPDGSESSSTMCSHDDRSR